MGGFVHGKIECYIANKDENFNCQNAFKNIYDFFTSHPQYTLVALNFGATNGPAASGAGTGTGYVDSVTSAAGATFGNNAWFVVRQNASPVRPYDVYHLFQWTGASNLTRGASFGTSPGNPGLINNSANSSPNNAGNAPAIGYACAIGISGSGASSGSIGAGFGSPWKGTTLALTGTLTGNDTKSSTQVWGAPSAGGTGVMIFPRSNSNSGSHHVTSVSTAHFAENCACIVQGNSNATNDWRMSIVADDDSWVLWTDVTDANSAIFLAYSGIYIPRNDLPSGSQATITPYCVITQTGVSTGLPWLHGTNNPYGDSAGSTALQGGIIGNTTASVVTLVTDSLNVFMNDINFQPSMAISSSVGARGGGFYDECQIPVGVGETSPLGNICGYLGEIDFVRQMYNVATPGVRWDFQRAFVGLSTLGTSQNYKYSIPWDSQNKTVPRTGTTRQGITFVRSGPA